MHIWLQLRSAPSFFWTRAVKRGGTSFRGHFYSCHIVLPSLSPLWKTCWRGRTMKSYKSCWQRGLDREVPVGFDAFRIISHCAGECSCLEHCFSSLWSGWVLGDSSAADSRTCGNSGDLRATRLVEPLLTFIRRWPLDVFDGLQLWMNLSMPGTAST